MVKDIVKAGDFDKTKNGKYLFFGDRLTVKTGPGEYHNEMLEITGLAVQAVVVAGGYDFDGKYYCR